jgi:hypothetical protein
MTPTKDSPPASSPQPSTEGARHTAGGAPTDKAHREDGDGTLAGSVPAGLSSDELRKLAESDKTDNAGTG